jgi:hypothetical protein
MLVQTDKGIAFNCVFLYKIATLSSTLDVAL